MVTELTTPPPGLLDAGPDELHHCLPGPTLLHLTGRHPRPLFVSVLLHGNEPTGLWAIQHLLRRYQQRELPRALSIFIGNISAARHGQRRLPEQPDYNRVWPGTLLDDCVETRMARYVFEAMALRQPFASVDVHNNTGLNPHYACINRLDDPFLQLAALFGRLVVYFTHPKGVQSAAFATLCPAVTLECGKPEQHYGVEHAAEYLDACLNLDHFPQRRLTPHDVDLFQTIAQVTIPPYIRFSYSDPHSDLLLAPNLDHLNFTETPAGTLFGTVRNTERFPVAVQLADGSDRALEFFSIENGQLQLKRALMPAMLTLNEQIIRQDCLCYLMARVVD